MKDLTYAELQLKVIELEGALKETDKHLNYWKDNYFKELKRHQDTIEENLQYLKTKMS